MAGAQQRTSSATEIDMSEAIQRLEARLVELSEDSNQIQAQADLEKRDLTEAESAKIQANVAEFERTNAEVTMRRKVQAQAAVLATPQPRAVKPGAVQPEEAESRPIITGGERADRKHGMFGFKGKADWLQAVKAAAYGRTDQRLMNAVSTYGQEGIGADGGFMVPPDFAAQVTQLVTGEESLVSRFRPITTMSNQVTVTVDETTPWGASGIYAEWLAEAGTFTQRKPVQRQVTATLQKVGALVPITDELLQDAPAIESYLTRKVGQAIASKVNEALITGNGTGKPLGLSGAPGIVTQAKSGATLAAKDLMNMLTRIPPESVGSALWIVHSSFLPETWSLAISNQPVYVNDLRVSPYGALLGRPVFVSEYCSSYNTLGDVYLFSPDGYLAAMKGAGIRTDVSIHFFFDQAVQAFRSYMRIGGTPLASAAIARKNGSLTLSHIINLQVRS